PAERAPAAQPPVADAERADETADIDIDDEDRESGLANADLPPTDDEADSADAGTVVGALGTASDPAPKGKVRAAPAVRRLALDLGVDITRITGTGIGGRVTSRDVQAAAAEVPPVVTPEPQAPSV